MAGRAGRIKRRTLLVLSAAASLPMGVSRSDAATKYWKNSLTTGYYYVGSNWSGTSPSGTDTGGVPGSSDTADLENTDALTHTITMYDFSGSVLNIASQGGGIDILTENTGVGGGISAASEVIGTGVSGAIGAQLQTDGSTNNYSSLSVGDGTGTTGIYNLSSGTIDVSPSSSPLGLTIGHDGNGLFTQSGGNIDLGANTSPVNFTMGTDLGSQGSYLMNGSSASLYTYGILEIGSSGIGQFNQTAGSVSTGPNVGGIGLQLGVNAGGRGTYLLSGASTLTINQQEDVGFNGTGIFNQSGGTHTVNYLNIANQPGSAGTYALTAGTLGVTQFEVGVYGNAVFNQSGGASSLGYVTIAGSSSSVGRAFLSGGSFTTTGNFTVASAGLGSFTQTGGNVSIGTASTPRAFYMGYSAGGVGTYMLNSAASILNVTGSSTIGSSGAASFNLNNGTFNTAQGLAVGDQSGGSGVLTVSGGTLNASNVETHIGTYGSGVFNQSGGTSNFNANLLFGVYSGSNGSGMLSNGTLNVQVGYEFVGYQGTGSFMQTGGAHTVSGILVVGFETSSGSYTLSNATSSLLVIGNEVNGAGPGNGVFSQSGGNHTVDGSLTLGANSGGAGTYNLSGGTLSVSPSATANTLGEYIGAIGSGTFNQTGGTHTVGSASKNQPLYLGYNTSGAGTYLLSGAASALNVNGAEYVGYQSSNGTKFIQTNGTHTVTQNLEVGYLGGGVGTYNLSGGSLNVGTTGTQYNQNEIVGDYGTGTFIQSGGTDIIGTPAVNQGLVLAFQNNSTGSYLLNNASATLTVYGAEEVGNGGSGGAIFNQTAGTHTVLSNLLIGIEDSGTFLLNGGSLAAGTTSNTFGMILGDNTGAIGTFVQTGGSDTIYSAAGGSTLSIANAVGGSGFYSLSGQNSTLTVNGNAAVGGSNTSSGGAGSFYVSGGTATITGTLKVWNVYGTLVRLSGGILSVGTLDTSSTPSDFNWTGGTLGITGAAGFAIGPGTALGSSLSVGSAQTLSVTNTFVTNSGSNLTIGAGGAVTANSENFSVGTDIIAQTGGTNAANFFYLGANPGAIGTYNQTGGTNTQVGMSIGNYPGGNGSYYLGGTGQLIANGNVYLGEIAASPAVGVLTITGGSATVGGTFYSYNASGCAINISGGSLQATVLDTSGVVNLQGGSFVTGTLITEGNPSNFHFTGGSLTLTNSSLIVGSSGQLGSLLNIGATQSVNIASNNGEYDQGVINQTGGTNAISGGLALGTNGTAGGYVLSGGNLTVAGVETIGGIGSGVFNQSSGTNAAGSLVLAAQYNYTGVYNLAAGSGLTLTTGEYIGQGGAGIFNQTGGIQTLGELGIGTTASGAGTLLINAGYTRVLNSVGVGGTPAVAGGTGSVLVQNNGILGLPAGTLTVFDNPANTVTVTTGGNISTGSVLLLGGTTTVGAGAKLYDSGSFNFSGTDSPLVYLASDNTSPGVLALSSGSGVAFNGTSGTAYILSSGAGTLPGMLSLGNGISNFNISPGSAYVAMVVGANVVNGAILKTGFGALQLSGNNNLGNGTAPGINVSQGTLQLGGSAASAGVSYALGGVSNNTYVAGGGTLDLNGWNVSSASLTLGGMGQANNGVLINTSLNQSTFGGSINLLPGLAYVGGTGPITLSGAVSGVGGGIYKLGFDTVTISGIASFGDGIDVVSGILNLTGSNSFKGGVSINGGTLAVSSDAALGDTGNSIVLNPGGTFQASGSFLTTRTFNAAGGTVSVDANQTLTVYGNAAGNGGIVGSGPFNSVGAGILRLTTPSTFNGSVVITNGTLSLSNTSGALPSVASIDLRTAGVLELNSSSALGGNQTNQDRISDSAGIILDGGSINLLGVDNGPTSESLGALNIASGASTIQLFNGSGAMASTTLTFGSLLPRATGATLSFNASNAAGSTLGTINKIFISGATHGPLGGWATVNGTDFAKYNTGQGVVPFTPSDYSINTFALNANVYLDPSVLTPPVPANAGNGSLTIATLNLAANNNPSYGTLALTQVAGTTLNISSGGLIKSGSNPATINGGYPHQRQW